MNSGVVRIVLGLGIVLLCFPAQALAQGAKPGVFGDESRDWGVAPTAQLRTKDYHAPTPRQIPGGKVVTTGDLRAMRDKQPAPFMIDVLGGNVHRTIAGAFWMIGAGAGDMSREEERRFAAAIAGFAGGDKNRPMVFLRGCRVLAVLQCRAARERARLHQRDVVPRGHRRLAPGRQPDDAV